MLSQCTFLNLVLINKLHDKHYVLSAIRGNLFALELLICDGDGDGDGGSGILFGSKSNLVENISVDSTLLYVS